MIIDLSFLRSLCSNSISSQQKKLENGIMAGPASHPSSSIYEPLVHGSNQIRILHLLPGSFEDDIRCKISISSLNSSFEALSYVWGDPRDTRMIEVQGETVKATKNLETALRHVRDTREPRDLWVDALCINQSDNSERTHQVGIMDTIYREAQKVIVWLGDEQHEIALELIETHGSTGDRHWFPGCDTGQEPWAQILMLLISLRDTKWFGRIWTLQEIVLAKSVTYLCGNHVFANGEIDGLLQSFVTHFLKDKCCDMDAMTVSSGMTHMAPSILPYLLQISDMIETGRNKAPAPFLEIASKFRHREATDPRDKVFGILGLTGDLTKDIIDYNAPVAAIYARAAIRLMEKTGNLDVLSHVLPRSWTSRAKRRGVVPSRPPGLASWAPDWSDTRPDENWRLRTLNQRETWASSFGACGRDSTPCLQPSAANIQRLVLKGRFCDTISQIGPPCEESNPGLYRLLGWQEAWRKMAGVDTRPEERYGSTAVPTLQSSTILNAFWRTLCANIDPLRSSKDKVCEADLATRIYHDRWWWQSLQTRKYGVNLTTDMRHSPEFERNRLFEQHVICISAGRRFLISNTGLFGLAPQDALEGDQIWVMNGGRKPLILRPLPNECDTDEGGAFTFVGDSYVHGIMSGELVEAGMSETTVTLI